MCLRSKDDPRYDKYPRIPVGCLPRLRAPDGRGAQRYYCWSATTRRPAPSRAGERGSAARLASSPR